MIAMEGGKFFEDIVSSLQTGMVKDLPAGDHLEGDAAEAVGHTNADVAWVLAGGFPVMAQDVEVVVATDEVVGNAQDGGAEFAIAVADQGTVGPVDLVTLITAGAQTGPAVDAARVGVIFHRPHLAGVIGGADDVDAREGQEQD